MKVCYVVDYRSPIARNWIAHWVEEGHEVHIISTYPVDRPTIRIASFQCIPVALSQLLRTRADNGGGRPNPVTPSLRSRLGSPRLANYATRFRHWLAPLDVVRCARRLEEAIGAIGPDLVHAMRIPYEGMFAAVALEHTQYPLIVSVWGNDFTLFASHYPLDSWLTNRTMKRASALHVDAARDLRLAIQWGFAPQKPSIILPGAGGVQADLFFPPTSNSLSDTGQPEWLDQLSLPADRLVVVNPRGYRGYVRNDVFFQAAARVIQVYPNAQFLCPAMRGVPEMEDWVRKLGLDGHVRLLPLLTRQQMAELFRCAHVTVSPATHDGTPNTLLEAMACGCFPVAGNIESIREWIIDQVNGFLCDPNDVAALTTAILNALERPDLRRQAAAINTDLIAARANYDLVMERALVFYHEITRMSANDAG